jgi:hypothetical protein
MKLKNVFKKSFNLNLIYFRNLPVLYWYSTLSK